MARTLRSAALFVLALALLLPLAALAADKKQKHVVKATFPLEVGQPLRVDIDGDLPSCQDGWDCLLRISDLKAPPAKALYLLEIDGEGNWIVWAPEEEEEEEEEEEKEESDEDEKSYVETPSGTKIEVAKLPEEDCDKLKLVEEDAEEKDADYDAVLVVDGGEGSSEDAAAPQATADEAPPAWMELPIRDEEWFVKCKREATFGTFKVEKARGSLSEEGGRHLVIPADLLPTDEFQVSTNGYWGAVIDGSPIGTAAKTGVIRVVR